MTNIHCETARAALKDAPLDTSILEKSKPEQRLWGAIMHYGLCSTCRPMGLAAIRGSEMKCEEAIRFAVAGKDLLFTSGNFTCTNLGELMAHEHIYGITVIKEEGGRHITCNPKQVLEGTVDPGIDTHPCTHKVCSDVRHIWISAPLSAHYDGDDEEVHGIERTLAIAQKAGWDIAPLLQAAPTNKLGKFQQLLLAM